MIYQFIKNRYLLDTRKWRKKIPMPYSLEKTICPKNQTFLIELKTFSIKWVQEAKDVELKSFF